MPGTHLISPAVRRFAFPVCCTLRAVLGRHGSVRPVRGQAMIELALSLPILIMLLMGVWSYWTAFQRVEVQSDAAVAMVELVSRRGEYNSTMRDAVRQQIDDSFTMEGADAYLFIHVTRPDASTTAIGTPAPAGASGAPTPPFDTGWESVTSISGLPVGTRVRIDVWSYVEASVPMLPIGGWQLPVGHAVSEVMIGVLP